MASYIATDRKHTTIYAAGDTAQEALDNAIASSGRLNLEPIAVPCTDALRDLYECGEQRIPWQTTLNTAHLSGEDLYHRYTNLRMRCATPEECLRSQLAAEKDGGIGAIDVDGRSCYTS